jgi:zinc protease
MLRAMNPDRVDPALFMIYSRVKNPADMKYVEESILNTVSGFKDNLVPADRLDAVKKRLRYQFALSLNNSEAIASTLAGFVALRRTPETINRLYEVYDSLTPEDLREAARKYLVENNRTIVTLTSPKP